MAMSNYLEGKIVDIFLRNTPYTPPVTVYLALFTADPGEAGSLVNEAAYTGYQRKACAWNILSGDQQTTNSNIITFGANGDPGSVIITHAGIFDQISNGSMLFYGALQNPKTLASGDVLQFDEDALTITLT